MAQFNRLYGATISPGWLQIAYPNMDLIELVDMKKKMGKGYVDNKDRTKKGELFFTN